MWSQTQISDVLTVEQDQSPGHHPGFQGVRPARLLLVPWIRGRGRDRQATGRSRALIRLRLTARRYRAICTLFSLFLLRLCNRKKKFQTDQSGTETIDGDRASGCPFCFIYSFVRLRTLSSDLHSQRIRIPCFRSYSFLFFFLWVISFLSLFLTREKSKKAAPRAIALRSFISSHFDLHSENSYYLSLFLFLFYFKVLYTPRIIAGLSYFSKANGKTLKML